MEPLRNSQNHTAKQESTDEPRLRVNWGMGHGVRHVVTFYRFLSFSHKEKWNQILALDSVKPLNSQESPQPQHLSHPTRQSNSYTLT